jgi:hypothetical protein
MVGYSFERTQKLKFEVVDDDDGKGGNVDIIGTVQTTMGQVMGARQQTFQSDLTLEGQKKSRGKIIVRGEGLENSNHVIKMQISCEEIGNVQGGCLGMCSQIAPVRYEIQRGNPQGTFNTVKVSEEAFQTNSPIFRNM